GSPAPEPRRRPKTLNDSGPSHPRPERGASESKTGRSRRGADACFDQTKPSSTDGELWIRPGRALLAGGSGFVPVSRYLMIAASNGHIRVRTYCPGTATSRSCAARTRLVVQMQRSRWGGLILAKLPPDPSFNRDAVPVEEPNAAEKSASAPLP